jgi:electron transport complex protein RnfB
MKISPKQIDQLLPQTQCGLCSYKGCMPYAEALATGNAEINLCPPGGVKGLLELGKLLDKDPTPFISEMERKTKPNSIAVIREAECIGCTKCIQACPVDAILGTGKEMHTVISNECTGCELCVSPCPVDCIDMIVVSENNAPSRANYFRDRFNAREARLQQTHKKMTKPINPTQIDKKSYILAAIERAKNKPK